MIKIEAPYVFDQQFEYRSGGIVIVEECGLLDAQDLDTSEFGKLL